MLVRTAVTVVIVLR